MTTEPTCEHRSNWEQTNPAGVSRKLGENGPGNVQLPLQAAHDLPLGRGLPENEDLMDTPILLFLLLFLFYCLLLFAILFVCFSSSPLSSFNCSLFRGQWLEMERLSVPTTTTTDLSFPNPHFLYPFLLYFLPMGSYCVAQTSFELLIFLQQLPPTL